MINNSTKQEQAPQSINKPKRGTNKNPITNQPVNQSEVIS